MQEDLNYFATSIVSIVTGYSFYKLVSSQWGSYNSYQLISKIQSTKIKTVDEELKENESVILKVSNS